MGLELWGDDFMPPFLEHTKTVTDVWGKLQTLLDFLRGLLNQVVTAIPV